MMLLASICVLLILLHYSLLKSLNKIKLTNRKIFIKNLNVIIRIYPV